MKEDYSKPDYWMNDKACRELATVITKTLSELEKHKPVPLPKENICLIIYQELKRSKLNKTKD